MITGSDCDIKFGSSNTTSRLDLKQADGSGAAMQSPSDSMSLQSAARHWYTIEKAKDSGTRIVSGGGERSGDPTPLTRSTDDGATWSGSVLNGTEANDMFASASTTLGGATVLVGGNAKKLYTSNDDGVTWTNTSPSPSAGNIRTIGIWDVAGSDTIWLAGSGSKVVQGADGGATWTAQSLPTPYGTSVEIRSISAVSATEAWLWGTVDGFSPPVMFHTTDGGTTWNVIPSGVPGDLNDVDMRPDGLGMIVGNSGVVLTTADAGLTWTQRTSGTTEHLTAVATTGSSTGTTNATSSGIGNISSTRLLFGLRTSKAQKPGSYTAGLQFSVIAP